MTGAGIVASVTWAPELEAAVRDEWPKALRHAGIQAEDDGIAKGYGFEVCVETD